MKEAKPYFGLGTRDKLPGFIYIGYVKDHDIGPSKRKPTREKVNWVNTYTRHITMI